MMFWVISYDVPNDRRRRQVAKILEGYGERVQYSVFECDLDEAKTTRLEIQLLRQIDEKEDDIRFYPLNRADIERARMLGKAELRRKRDHQIV
jgi:CRISPR-associated protein Cas2